MSNHSMSLVFPSQNPLKRAWEDVTANRQAYIVLNISYYGLVLAGMVYAAFNPSLQTNLLAQVGDSFRAGPLGAVSDAYSGGEVARAMLLTFLVNLMLGSIVEMTLPGLIIPFAGIFMGFFRAGLWGLLLSPANASIAGPMIPHALTLVLEGQGYILAMLAAYIQGKAWIFPRTYGITGHWHGYVEGLRRSLWVYLLVNLVLASAAVYEALEVIYLAPLF